MRCAPMRLPMGDARLWEMYAYGMPVYGGHTLWDARLRDAHLKRLGLGHATMPWILDLRS